MSSDRQHEFSQNKIEDQTRGKSPRKIWETKMIEDEQNFVRYVIKHQHARRRIWRGIKLIASNFIVVSRSEGPRIRWLSGFKHKTEQQKISLAFKWSESRDSRAGKEKNMKSKKKHVDTNGETRIEEWVAVTVAKYYSKYSATLIFCLISNRRDKVKKFSPVKWERYCFLGSFGDFLSILLFIRAHFVDEKRERHRETAMQ